MEQQLKVQKREKQYLIEDDPNEGPEQKRDERQSTPTRNNHSNTDANGNSKIINIRLQPPPNIVTGPKQLMKPETLPRRIDTMPQRIPTKIPVVLKTVKVIPGPSHALRMKILEHKINESIANANKEKAFCQNTGATPTPNKDSIPYFTIEDKLIGRSSPNNDNDENSNLEGHSALNIDDKETSGNSGNSPANKDSNHLVNEHEHDHHHPHNPGTVPKPIHFFVDEPEPLPPSFRRQQHLENSKEVTANKLKEIPIVRNGKPSRKDESRRKDTDTDDENDPDIVKLSNGTHIISIKKIRNHDKFNTDHIARSGEEITVPTEERIVNQPPKPKPVEDEPEKHTFSITEKFNTDNVGIPGLMFNDKMKEDKGKSS